VPFLVPHSARIPDNRFVFFEDHLQERLARFRAPSSQDHEAAEDFYERYLRNNQKPDYFYLNNRIPTPDLGWFPKLVRRFFHNDPHDETHNPFWWGLRCRLSEVLNARLVRLFPPFVPLPRTQRPFVLIALHKQPESSIDVLGSYLNDQVGAVRTLARSLPITHDLYVKEHSNALGDRPFSYYRRLEEIPGVFLINPHLDSRDLIKKADLVVSISGTISYEAALLGTPALTMVPMFFSSLLQGSFNPYSSRRDDLIKALEPKPEDRREQNVEFLAEVFANSFPGTISDPVFQPSCVNPDNLEAVSRAFSLALAAFRTPVRG
jgi:hypothetical protein